MVDEVQVIDVLSRDPCTFCFQRDNFMEQDVRSRVYTVNGVEVIVGIGPRDRVIAMTRQHRVGVGPEVYELRQAILKWTDEHIPLSPRMKAELQFGPYEQQMRRSSLAHPLEYRLYPPVMAVSSGNLNTLPAPGPHPHLAVNIFELRAHFEWPIRVADEYVKVAQGFVGYFYGENVEVKQMSNIVSDERGAIDATVKRTGEPWVEPFEMADDCPMCERMTDEDVENRVAAFQWEIDKETRSRVLPYGGPEHGEYGEGPEAREAYHRAIDAHVAEHPELFRPLPLIRLPHRLKLALCIQWNHVVRDWLKEDPRYSYSAGHYYVVWTERLGGLDDRPTRSDTYGSSDLAEAYSLAFYGFGHALENRVEYQRPPVSGERDERDIWNE